MSQQIQRKYVPLYFMGVGITSFNKDAFEASSIGINLNFVIANFYMDFSSNYATGKGEELDFYSSWTTKADKLFIGMANVGYAIRMNKFSFAPMVGLGWTREIWEDPILFDTYFYGKRKYKFNAGAIGILDFFGNGGIYLSVGTFEKMKGGFWFGF